jgi:hypothetical protein
MHLTLAGMSVNEAAKTLSREFNVSERQIWLDWETKDKWVPALFKVKPEQQEKVLAEALANLNEVRSEAYKTYLAAETETGRSAALRVLMEAVKTEIQVRQSVGLLPTEPIRVDQRILMIKGQWWRPKDVNQRDGTMVPASRETAHFP